MEDTGRNERWRATARLALVALAVLVAVILFFLSIVASPDAPGFPFGLVVAATGLPLAGVILLFWYATRQEGLDRRYGLYED